MRHPVLVAACAVVAMATAASASPAAGRPAPRRPDPRAQQDRSRNTPGRFSLSARLGLAPDQAIYRQEYVRRRAFPDSILQFIPGSKLYQLLRDSLAIIPVLPHEPVKRAAVPCQWTTAGPTNVPGRVTGLAVTSQGGSIGTPRVIATSVGGVWRSLDGGRRWERVSDGMKPGVFGAVAVTPNLPSEVFVGGGDPSYQDPSRAGGPGIWMSASGGDAGSWQHVGPVELDDAVIFRFQIAPAAPHHVYVATSKGVYRGDRTGATIAWSLLKGASAHEFDAPTSDIAVVFPPSGTGDPIVYAGAYESGTIGGPGVWKFTGSATAGQWVKRSGGISTLAGVIHLGLAPSDPQRLYAKITNKSDFSLLGIYKTTTGAESPTPACLGASPCGSAWCNIKRLTGNDDDPANDSELDGRRYDDYNGAVAVHPTNPDLVFVGNKSLFWINTGCPPWFDFGSSIARDSKIHEDQHALAFDPDDPGILWVGGDGGVFKSVELTSGGVGRWEAVSHGMTTTEFWDVSTQQAEVTPLLGGMQDNGTGVTYGNRTWYAHYDCDGAQAALDAANSATVYQSCNGNLEVLKTVLPGFAAAWLPRARASEWPRPRAPFAADLALPGRLISAGVTSSGQPAVLKTTDARLWTPTAAVVPQGMEVSCVAIAPPTGPACGISPATPFNTFYVGLRSTADAPPPFKTGIIHSIDGGAWTSASAGVPLLSPNAIAVDRCDVTRAVAAFGGDRGQAGEVRITTDGGVHWVNLPFPATWPPAPAIGVAIDPFDRDVIYAATAIGVYRGKVSLAPTLSCAWERFNQGLSSDALGIVSIDATSLEVNDKTGTLVLGTMGYGAFQRDIRPDHACAATLLSIRDNVFDRGEEPSPSGQPDPEHAVCANPSCDTYKPDDSIAGRLEWWDSPDLRVDLPCPQATAGCTCDRDPAEPRGDPPDGALDAVEVESCPTGTYDCPIGMMRDRNPRRGCVNRVYVQVTNRGPLVGRDLRVMALWTDATTTLPLLPQDFWSTTFPATGACQQVDQSSGWHLLDPAHPCKTISRVEPDRPEVVYFDWLVPPAAPEHSCVMALVESADDPIPDRIRGVEFAPWVFVKETHQIGLRNLHVVDSPSTLKAITFLDSLVYRSVGSGAGSHRLIVSRAQLEPADMVGVLLPATGGLILKNVDSLRVHLTADERREADALGLDTTVVYRVRHPEGEIDELAVAPVAAWRIGLRVATARIQRRRLAPRLTVMAMQDSVVLGGNTYVMRFRR